MEFIVNMCVRYRVKAPNKAYAVNTVQKEFEEAINKILPLTLGKKGVISYQTAWDVKEL